MESNTSGIFKFFKNAKENEKFGAAIFCAIVAVVLFIIVRIMAPTPGGLITAIAVVLFLAGCGAIVFFFIELAELFEDI